VKEIELQFHFPYVLINLNQEQRQLFFLCSEKNTAEVILSLRVEERQGTFSRASSMKEGPSELPKGAPSLTEPSGRKPGSSSLFGALGFLRSTTS
jgi:hypothetical protein